MTIAVTVVKTIMTMDQETEKIQEMIEKIVGIGGIVVEIDIVIEDL